MPNQTPSFIIKLTQYLPKLEAFFLAGVLIGVMLKYAGMDSIVFITSLAGLATTFFLSAYRPLEIPATENEKHGFIELLMYTILPKIAWISAAVVTVGILFYFIGAEGYEQMLFIGGTTMVPVVLILLYGMVTGVKHISAVTPVLQRIVPLMLLAAYVYFNA